MKRKNFLRNQDGFTLIEIIAVLVILGILAAVAVPKYIDMTAKAEERTAQAVRGELQARANQFFGKQILDGNGTVTAAAVTAAAETTFIANCGDAIVETEFFDWTVANDDKELEKIAGPQTFTITIDPAMSATTAAQIKLDVTTS